MNLLEEGEDRYGTNMPMYALIKHCKKENLIIYLTASTCFGAAFFECTFISSIFAKHKNTFCTIVCAIITRMPLAPFIIVHLYINNVEHKGTENKGEMHMNKIEYKFKIQKVRKNITMQNS